MQPPSGHSSLLAKSAQLVRANLILILLAIALVIAGLCCLNDIILYSPDSANYLSWARSLSIFKGFSDSLGPEPSHYVINAPLYPVLLAPVAFLFPLNVIAAKVFMLLCAVLMLWLFFRFIGARLGRNIALVTAALLLINPLFFLFSTQVLSEIPFGISLILCFMMASRLEGETEHEHFALPAMVATICAALFLREIGFTLVLAAAFYFLLRKEYRRTLWAVLVPAFLYLLWFIRNEVITAGIEHPEVRNTLLLFSHFYTGNDASVGDEIFARLGANISFYLPRAGALLFFPEFTDGSYSVVSQSAPSMVAVRSVLDIIRTPVAICVAAMIVFGGWRMARKTGSGRLIALFTLLYMAFLLFYPINDARFLFPLLVPFLLFGAEGTAEALRAIERTASVPRRLALGGVLVIIGLLAAPNLVWLNNFIGNSLAFSRSPGDAYSRFVTEASPPREFLRPLRDAGQWLMANTDPSTVYLSRYKEAALWTGGRKVLTADPYIPLENFEYLIRDYGVRFIVTPLEAHVLRDFEFQMAMSGRYRFDPVFRTGDLEILRVIGRRETSGGSAGDIRSARTRWSSAEESSIRSEFMRGLHLLGKEDYPGALASFNSLGSHPGLEVTGAFYAAIAVEFSMNIDGAAELFSQFRSLPQAGSLLRQAQYHQNFIGLLRSTSAEEDKDERAYLYHSVSIGYWQLGFRRQALDMLYRALNAEPEYFAGLVLGVVYGLQAGDTSAARAYYGEAKSATPGQSLVRELDTVFSTLDLLPREPRGDTLRVLLCDTFTSMGLSDLAIDCALEALHENPQSPSALERLGSLYMAKERYAPALSALERLCTLRPDEAAAQAARDELRRRW